MSWYKFNVPGKEVIKDEFATTTNRIKVILDFIPNLNWGNILVVHKMLIDGSMNIYLSPEVSKAIKRDLYIYNAIPCLDPSVETEDESGTFSLGFGNPNVLGNPKALGNWEDGMQ